MRYIHGGSARLTVLYASTDNDPVWIAALSNELSAIRKQLCFLRGVIIGLDQLVQLQCELVAPLVAEGFEALDYVLRGDAGLGPVGSQPKRNIVGMVGSAGNPIPLKETLKGHLGLPHLLVEAEVLS